MEIGTLIIEIWGKLLQHKSCEFFIATMDPTFSTISDKYDADYKRFGYEGGHLLFVIPLKELWRSDVVFKKMRKELDRLFVNWAYLLTLTIHEKGG